MLLEIGIDCAFARGITGLVLKSSSNQTAAAQTWLKVVTNLETTPE